jgi:hypothetical protein
VLLNFYLYSLRVPVILVCCFLLNTPAKLLASFVNLSDLPSRYESGDFFVNSFYLWWTSLYYLPSIFIVFTLCFIFYKNVVTFPLVILPVLLAVCSCGADITDHWHLNPTFVPYVNPSIGFNVLLSNSINKYHPLIFYSSVVLLLSATISSSNHLRLHYTSTLFLFTTLFLGSWWAYQEGSWGGWWNWDPSEVLGLLAALGGLRVIHAVSLRTSLLSARALPLFYASVVLITYVFIQLNFNLVSHNFGTKPDASVGTAPLLIATIVLVVRGQLNYSSSYRSSLLRTLSLFPSKPFSLQTSSPNVPIFIITLFSVTLLYLSFLPVLNDFCSRFLGAGLVAHLSTTNPHVVGLLVVGLLPHWSVNPRTPILVIYGAGVGEPLASYTNPTHFPLTSRAALHFLLLIFLLLSTINVQTPSSLWSITPLGSPNSSHLDFAADRFGYTTLLSYPFYESSATTITSNAFSETVWGFERRGSAVTRYLSHNLSADYSYQSLQVGKNSSPFEVLTLDLTAQLLTLTLVLLLGILWKYSINPSVIKF